MARWCYNRGVDERVLGCGEQLLKAAVDQALGRPAPAHLEHAPWQQTATVLRQRRDCDRDHQITPPPPPRVCPAPWRSTSAPPTPAGPVVCGDQLDRIVVDEGYDTHPCCDRPDTTGSQAVLEHTAQMLAATLLAQPA